MKKFIEDDVELDYSSVFSFLQTSVCMLLLAPYKLMDTVTTRMMYLKRKQMTTMLLYSIVVAVVVTVLNVVFMLYFDRFSWTRGKFPLVIMIVVVGVLLAFYLYFGMFDLMAYAQLDSLELTKPAGEVGEPKQEEVENEKQEEVEKEKPAEPEVPREEPSVEKKEFSFCWGDGKKIQIGRRLEGAEQSKFMQEMDASEDPSEFLTEEFLAKADVTELVDDANLESLNISVIPIKFKALT